MCSPGSPTRWAHTLHDGEPCCHASLTCCRSQLVDATSQGRRILGWKLHYQYSPQYQASTQPRPQRCRIQRRGGRNWNLAGWTEEMLKFTNMFEVWMHSLIKRSVENYIYSPLKTVCHSTPTNWFICYLGSVQYKMLGGGMGVGEGVTRPENSSGTYLEPEFHTKNFLRKCVIFDIF